MLAPFKNYKTRELLAIVLGVIPIVLGIYLLDASFYSHLMRSPFIIVDLVLLILVILAFIENPGRFMGRLMFGGAITVTALLVFKLIMTFLIENNYWGQGA